MLSRSVSLISAGAVAVFACSAADAAPRAFVASTGSDTNTSVGCAPTMPCRSFAAAVATVDAGGEVIALDSAGYGAVTINKSVTIAANPGVIAGVSAASGVAIDITGSGITVTLRGLNVRGAGASHGITSLGTGVKLAIENCIVSNFTGFGIQMLHSVLKVVDSTVRENGTGIQILNG